MRCNEACFLGAAGRGQISGRTGPDPRRPDADRWEGAWRGQYPGRGQTHQLAQLYATFLLWLLSEFFERLPEVGDPEKPKLVFFFDEAHLLFSDLPKVIEDKVHQVVRLVRSKGVGVFFVTQNPIDVPDGILGQLGNRVQHAVRAFTPKDQKAVKAAAQTFRTNPEVNIEQVILELGVGEALVSFLDEKGTPAMVERALVFPPRSQIGPITPEQRQQIIHDSLVAGVYEQPSIANRPTSS